MAKRTESTEPEPVKPQAVREAEHLANSKANGNPGFPAEEPAKK